MNPIDTISTASLARDELGRYIPVTPIVSDTSTAMYFFTGLSTSPKIPETPTVSGISTPIPKFTNTTSMATVPYASTSKSKPSYNNLSRKSIPSKRMVLEAFKTLAIDGRKSLSLAAIRKFISSRYLFTPSQMNIRMRYVKKYLTQSIENGQILSVKGAGLQGSFRLSSKGLKPKHKNEKKKVHNSDATTTVIGRPKKSGRPKKMQSNKTKDPRIPTHTIKIPRPRGTKKAE